MKSVFRELNNSMLKDHRCFSISNESHYPNNKWKQYRQGNSNSLDSCLGLCLVINLSLQPFIEIVLVFPHFQYPNVLMTFLEDSFQVQMFCAGIVKNGKVIFTPRICINLNQQ